MTLRIGIVGARRAAQGIGQFIARELADLGADVCAIVGTRPETLAAAAEALRAYYGPSVRGYLTLDEMLRRESLDAVAICSPHDFHAEHLAQALAAGVHVLCEKPLVFTPLADNRAVAEPLVEGFAAAGKVLMVNTQWPYTLPAFDQCYPAVRANPFERLEMLLAPAVEGLEMIPNALPHVLSMLLACAPAGGRVENIRCDKSRKDRMDVSFDYVHAVGSVAVSSRSLYCPEQPRPAGYAINGSTVARTLRLTDYSIFFTPIAAPLWVAGETAQKLGVDYSGAFPPAPGARHNPSPQSSAVRLEDPLRLLLADFISRTRREARLQPIDATEVDATVLDGVRLLDEIYRAAAEA
ncbi:MAG: Gfo/Idh/MocA family oxidoreductase [Planctomycetia bacterium]|nr:Gfo/Idh/MocA family oxidoreductase [Planctomycetia bacterium]